MGRIAGSSGSQLSGGNLSNWSACQALGGADEGLHGARTLKAARRCDLQCWHDRADRGSSRPSSLGPSLPTHSLTNGRTQGRTRDLMRSIRGGPWSRLVADLALTFGAVSGHPLGPRRGRTMVGTSGSLRPFDRGYGQTTVGPMVLPTLSTYNNDGYNRIFLGFIQF